MRILTALLCIACTRAYMILPDFFNPMPPFGPPGHMFNEPGIDPYPHIDSYPHIDDSLPHVPNYPNYPHWGYPKPHEPRPHHPGVHPPLYYDHHGHYFYPHDFIPPFDYQEPKPIPKVIEPPKDSNVPDPDEESTPKSPHQQSPIDNMNNLKYLDLASTVENNLKVAAKFAADLEDDTFDSYYDDNYLQAVEEYYPWALLEPIEVSRKVQFYTDLFSKKTVGLKEIAESGKCRTHAYVRDGELHCDTLYAWFMTRLHDYYREGTLLEALADLSATYDQMSGNLMKISDQYLELPYLLRGKDSDLKELVRKFHRVFELMLPPKQWCQEYQDDWVAPKDPNIKNLR